MVRSKPQRPTRERLLVAALAEFAARGFDGAKVDRIAQRASVNKAMLYYHFRSKAALYAEVLRGEFGAVGDAVAAVRERGGPPPAQLSAFVAAIAAETASRPHLPPIWLREVAEGGRHLDETVVLVLRRVLGTLAAILEDGRRAGDFGPAHPFLTQMSIVAPLMFCAASAPLRDRMRHVLPPAAASLDPLAVLAHVQASTLAVVSRGVAVPGKTHRSSAEPRSRTRRRAS